MRVFWTGHSANHSGLRGLPRFIKGICWATGLFLRTPFTGAGVNKKASPPGRHQEQASKQCCAFSPTAFSSVQCSEVRLRVPSLQDTAAFYSTKRDLCVRPPSASWAQHAQEPAQAISFGSKASATVTFLKGGPLTSEAAARQRCSIVRLGLAGFPDVQQTVASLAGRGIAINLQGQFEDIGFVRTGKTTRHHLWVLADDDGAQLQAGPRARQRIEGRRGVGASEVQYPRPKGKPRVLHSRAQDAVVKCELLPPQPFAVLHGFGVSVGYLSTHLVAGVREEVRGELVHVGALLA